jgi:hypothetical protein
MAHNLYTLPAAGTALTSSTAETVLASYTLPANHAQTLKRYRVKGAVVASSTNSTDTLQVQVRIGTTTLTGTVVHNGTAVDVANADVITFDFQIDVRTAGASGSMICHGTGTIEGAAGTVTSRAIYKALTPDTTAALKIEVTGTWSVSSGSNICAAQALSVDEL